MKISELKELSLFELIMLYHKQMKLERYSHLYKEMKKARLSKNHEDYILLDLREWNSNETEILLQSYLVGMLHFFFNLTNKRCINIGGFNSVLDCLNGEESVLLYINSIKWFPKRIKHKIKKQGLKFPDLEYPEFRRTTSSDLNYLNDHKNWLEEAAGTNDPEVMNTVYWNLY